MKNIKMLSLSFVTAFSLVGIGFAAWQDNLTIENTVSTGQLNIEFVKDEKGLASSVFSIDDAGQNYVKLQPAKVSEDNKKLSISADNMYPGSMVGYTSKAQNKGTIPADISDVKLDFTTDNALLKQNLIIAGGYRLFDKNGSIKRDSDNNPIEGFFTCSLGELEAKLNSMLNGIRMDPDDYISFGVPDEKYIDKAKVLVPEFSKDYINHSIIYMPKLNKDQNELQKQTIMFDIKLNFQQFNKSEKQ